MLNLQIRRIEEQNDVFAFVVGQFNSFEIAIHDRIRIEIRSWFANESFRHCDSLKKLVW